MNCTKENEQECVDLITKMIENNDFSQLNSHNCPYSRLINALMNKKEQKSSYLPKFNELNHIITTLNANLIED